MKRAILPPSLMITSIIGFTISAVYTISGAFERFFASWGENAGMSLGFAFCFAFVIMFISSVISITPSDEELMELK
ncbi:hypothetical protein HOA56_00755 [archaeon]|jgi:hypothetical protein|nr:hypothetical protein [archaeon]